MWFMLGLAIIPKKCGEVVLCFFPYNLIMGMEAAGHLVDA